VTLEVGAAAPSPCRGDGSSLEEKLEALSSISSVSVLTSTNDTATAADSWSETNNVNVCAMFASGVTGTANVNRISFIAADDAVGDVEFLQITDRGPSTAPNFDSIYTQREHVKGSAPFVNEVQTVSTKSDAADLAGSFTLSFEDEVTTTLPYDASADALRDALLALSTVSSVEVSRGANADNGFT
jgi:hypothetical protein